MRISESSAMAQRTQLVNTSAKVIESKKVEEVQKESLSMQPKEETKVTLEEAVEAINDFLKAENKTSKFVLHDGLDKYYIRLVDSQTDEVIKEIPPESLLNAFYEMKKLAGMIVDEKI
ncbi:flagellar protein FlaG [Caryophanon tenue]|uniref:Flagellar biosynthesis protein FlaG n=1 Tax=Caryophanon tenue TaxID=33978 RepID=A0A1C0YK26_9BACL|nr:flagellar protein FlaG [Caryophanon tenue]OCS87429.1 hypothetical protein A6M13_08915 [Caryophanon tenue]